MGEQAGQENARCTGNRIRRQRRDKFREKGQSWSPFCPRRKALSCHHGWFHRTTIEFVSELLGLDSSSRTSLSLSPTIAHPNDFIHEAVPCLESNRSSIAQCLDLCTGGILSLNWEEVNSSMGFCESYIPRYSKKIFLNF